MSNETEPLHERELTGLGKFIIKPLSFIDKTPLKYLGSGYWVEKYGLKSKEVIDKYEKEAEELKSDRKLSDLETLTLETKNDIIKLNLMGYGAWMLSFFPVVATSLLYGVGKASNLFDYINRSIETPFLGEMLGFLGAAGVLSLGTFVVHDFACPSSIRKYLNYLEKGDERMCNILNWAGFMPYSEFHRVAKKFSSEDNSDLP